MIQPQVLQRVSSNCDWDSLRFPGEREIRAEAERLSSVRSLLEAWSDPLALAQGSGMRSLAPWKATPACCPELHEVGQSVRRLLGVTADIELYPCPSENGWIVRLADGPSGAIRLAISSFLFQRLNARERLFYVGRAIGQQLLHQLSLVADPTEGIESTTRETLLPRGLWRFQELSRDRVGLLCCQDIDSAVRAIVKVATGLPDELIAIGLPALLGERVAEQQAMVAADHCQFNLLRVSALQHFFGSDKYLRCLEANPDTHRPIAQKPSLAPQLFGSSAPFAATNTRDLEENTDSIETRSSPQPRAVMESPDRPGPLPEPPAILRFDDAEPVRRDTDQAARKFLCHGALWLSNRKAELTEGEEKVLDELFEAEFSWREERSQRPHNSNFYELSCRLLAPALRDEDLEKKLPILEDLLRIAVADGELAPDTKGVLHSLGAMIGLTVDDVEGLAAEYLDPEYATYQFQPDQRVEVRLDGEWTPGTIQSVEPTGDVRVRFADDEVLRLSPTADLIRPQAGQRAG